MSINEISVKMPIKLNVVRHNAAGKHQFGVWKTSDSMTVCSILKNEDKIKECGEIATGLRALKLNSTLCIYTC